MNRLHGVFIPMITPLFEDGRVDLGGLVALAEHLLHSESVDGLFALGGTGEYMCLSVGERMAITRALGQVQCNGKVIVANIGGVEAEQMLELASCAAVAGLDAIAAVVPAEIDDTPEALLRYFAPLRDAGLPLVVYWTPHVVTQKPDVDILSALMEIPNFAGIKDSSKDMEAFAAICVEHGEQLSIFQGVEMLHLPSLACGSVGVIGGGLNLYPALLAEITRAFAAHDLPTAMRLQRTASLNWDVLNSRNSFRWILKRVWAAEGIITGTHCRESDDAPVEAAVMDRIEAMLSL